MHWFVPRSIGVCNAAFFVRLRNAVACYSSGRAQSVRWPGNPSLAVAADLPEEKTGSFRQALSPRPLARVAIRGFTKVPDWRVLEKGDHPAIFLPSLGSASIVAERVAVECAEHKLLPVAHSLANPGGLVGNLDLHEVSAVVRGHSGSCFCLPLAKGRTLLSGLPPI